MEALQRVVTRGSLLVVLLILVTVPGSVLADLAVSPHSQYCTQHPSFLSCDFKGIQEVSVCTGCLFIFLVGKAVKGEKKVESKKIKHAWAVP